MNAPAGHHETVTAKIEEVGGGFIWIRMFGSRARFKAATQDVERAACARLYRPAKLIGDGKQITSVGDP